MAVEFVPEVLKLRSIKDLSDTTICHTCTNHFIYSTARPDVCKICVVNKNKK